MQTGLHEISQCPKKAPTRAFSLLKVRTSAFFTIKNLLRHFANLAFKYFAKSRFTALVNSALQIIVVSTGGHKLELRVFLVDISIFSFCNTSCSP